MREAGRLVFLSAEPELVLDVVVGSCAVPGKQTLTRSVKSNADQKRVIKVKSSERFQLVSRP
jgi:hypothetical protein